MGIAPHEQLAHFRLAEEVAGLKSIELVQPEERDVFLGEMRFHYLDWGYHGCRAILFLHGGGLTSHTWDLVCLSLRKEYHCLALDQRGHGESDWSPQLDYGVEVQRSDIEAFVDLLRLERFILVGMSMGGVNAIAYAARHSRRLAGLVLVDVGPDVNLGGVERIKQFMLHQAPNGKWRRKCDLRRWLHTDIRQSVAKLRELWTDVPQIRCPTLVVRGALSDIFLDEDAERLASALPDGRSARVDGAGHIVQGDNPRKLVETLRAFFRDINV